MKKETIKTIRFALNLLKDLNVSIAMRTASGVRFERAKLDVIKAEDAILDFENYVNENQKGDDFSCGSTFCPYALDCTRHCSGCEDYSKYESVDDKIAESL